MIKKNEKINGLISVELDLKRDFRGEFTRLFCLNELSEVLGRRNIQHVNLSINYNKGIIRGLHFQKNPYAEIKIIKCLSEKIFDVAVDIRRNSSSFLDHSVIEMTEADNHIRIIPEGFAHGFQVLESDSRILYMHTNTYMPEYESGLRYDDPVLKIEWPLKNIELSKRDNSFVNIDNKFEGVTL